MRSLACRLRQDACRLAPLFIAMVMLAACLPSTDDKPTLTRTGFERLTLVDPPQQLPRTPLNIDGDAADISIPSVRTYMRNIVAKLMRVMPQGAARNYDVDVFLTADEYGALASAQGDILVGMGVFAFSGTTEDQLAFLLAHELAHLYYGDPSDKREDTQLDKITRRLTTVLLTGHEIVNKFKQTDLLIRKADLAAVEDALARLTVTLDILQIMRTGIVAPAYDREREMRADALGFQLLVDAGYTGIAASEVIAGVSASQKRLAETTAMAIRSAANSAKVILQVGGKYGAVSSFDFLPFNPTEIVFDVATGIAVQVFCEFAASHPDQEARKNQIDELLMGVSGPAKRVDENFKPVEDVSISDPVFERRKEALRAGQTASNAVSDIMDASDPFRSIQRCSDDLAADASEKLEDIGNALIAAFDKKLKKDVIDYKAITIEELDKQAKRVLAEIRTFQNSGNRSLPYLWSAFGDIRQHQARLSGDEKKKKSYLKNAVENFATGLARSQDATVMLRRKYILALAELGDVSRVEQEIKSLEADFGEGWFANLELVASVLAKDVPKVVGASLKCQQTDDYFVRERCLYNGVKYRPAFRELGIDPETGQSLKKNDGGFFGKWFD